MANVIEFRWTVSRGRDTYGYNICTAWLNGDKVVGRCNGGGYDMRGTSFGYFLMKCYPERLKKLAEENRADLPLYAEADKYENIGATNNRKFYGMSVYVKSKADPVITRVNLDGGCGFDSIMRVANAIGIRLEYVPTKHKDNTTWLVHDDKPEDAEGCN